MSMSSKSPLVAAVLGGEGWSERVSEDGGESRLRGLTYSSSILMSSAGLDGGFASSPSSRMVLSGCGKVSHSAREHGRVGVVFWMRAVIASSRLTGSA